ncbi:hypothetical protein J0X15_12410 [Roseibium sp. CAU 1637]|uniref:ArsR family transcriptional regulator n=1 Tax=Roseibium limicola TaxID=2816037 RepID=A0A939JA34_9HYPH|nr:hypothetical protein [Roseibium limicola]
MNYKEHAAADCRLIILKVLAQEADHRLNETMLSHVLETFGHSKSREYIRQQLTRLEELSAIQITEAGSIKVAELLRAGLDHVERRSFLEGVLKPSIGG